MATIEEIDKEEGKIPFHARFGLRHIQILLILLAIVLVLR